MPTKEQVRRWQQDRIKERKPLPDAKTIKRELGWELVEAARENNFPVRIDPEGCKS